MTDRPTDPMERIVYDALIDAKVDFVSEQDNPHHLDFYLPGLDLHIEVMRMHTPRVAVQMARVDHVVVAQGPVAVRWVAKAIRDGALV